MPNRSLHQWKRGDELKAEWLDDQRRAIEGRITTHYPSGSNYDEHYSKIAWVRLGEVVGVQSSSGFMGRTGTVNFYNPNTGEPVGAHEVEVNASMFYDLPYDADDLIPCVWQQGHLHPIWARTVRHFITVADDGYPLANHCPNVYPIKFVRIEYLEEAGSQSPEISYLDESEGPDDYVLNLFEGEESYIPEGALGWCYSVTRQWFTHMAWAEGTCSSSSSSSESQESSSSSSSQSSSSSSSQSSSSSSSSQSSSSSSSTSSSSSSSTSSSSDSSSSTSSSESSSSSSSESSSSESSSSQSSSSQSQNSSESSSVIDSEGCDPRFPEFVYDIDGYDPAKTQILGHVQGCLKFFDTEACE